MPKPRNALISLDATPYYHCSSRCGRRAYLCGIDPITGANYEHRRQWIENKLLELTTVFSIDLAACAVYVDLNPIRAKLANTVEASDHTSIQRRIKQATKATQPNDPLQQDKQLLAFAGNPRQKMPKGLPFQLTDYMELVDWTGKIMRGDKRGAIPTDMPPILQRLNIDRKQWLNMTVDFESRFKTLVGDQQKVKKACKQLGQNWSHSLKACRESFPS